MEKNYFILLLFTIVIPKLVRNEDDITEVVIEGGSSASDDANTDGSTSNSYDANTTEADDLTANETSTFDPNATVEIPTTKRPIILPKIPEAFQARIRLSRTSHPAYAYNAIVSYQLKKNRAAITKQDGKSKDRQIFDFNLNRVSNISGHSCLVENVPEDSTEDLTFPFPFSTIDGQKKMNGPLSVFRLDGNDTEMAEEAIFVGGIPCTEYFKTVDIGYVNSCLRNVQCRIRHFFSNPEWKNPNCKGGVYCNQMPVRIDVECGESTMSCYYLKLILSVLEFHEGIKDEGEFQQLPGVYCEDATSQPFPTLSSSVRATLKEKDILKNTLRNRKLWWSETLNIFRVDEIVEDSDTVSLITDYNANVSYAITKLDTKCQTKLPDREKPTVLSLLVGTEKKNIKRIQKVGKRRCELSECEVWTGETVSGDSFDIYLNTQNSSRVGDFIPVFVDLFRKNEVLELYSRREFGNYVPALGEWSAFDVSSCFADASNTPFQLTIKGDIGEKWTIPSFRESIYNKIWNYSRLISPLRLQDFQIVPETNETILVKGVVIDISSTKNELTYEDITSEDALENIRALIEREDVFTEDEGYRLRVTDFKTEKRTSKPDGKRYGPGDMAGLAIGMILVGLVLGTFLILVVKRKKMRRG